ncbi:unnamed protein product [Urochloa humidicola]
MSKLEFEEVKGLQDLGFTFTHAELGRGSATSTSSRDPPRLHRGGGDGGMDAWGAHRPAAGLPESLVRDASCNNSPRARHPRRLLALAARDASRRCSASPERRCTEVDGLREHVKKSGLAKKIELVISSPLLRHHVVLILQKSVLK